MPARFGKGTKRMPAFLTKSDEQELRSVLDDMASTHNLSAEKKESYFEGFYVDRVWYTELESQKVPVAAFEIERGVPSNERLRKDIVNIATTRAPVGFIVLPHHRILEKASTTKGANWFRWYQKKARRLLEIYGRPFEPYVSILIVDADVLLKTRSLDKARRVRWTWPISNNAFSEAL